MRILGKVAPLVCVAVSAVALSGATTACSRDDIEAVNLANEGDKSRDSNPDEAISKYEQASKLDPKNHKILYKLLRADRKKEDWPKVAATAAQAAKQAPTFANYSFEQGHALAIMAQKGPTTWAEAKDPLQQAITRDPNIFDAYEDLAEVQIHMDDEQGALQSYTKAIDTKPDEIQFYGPLADLYLQLGFRDQAEQVLKEGISFAKDADAKQSKYLFAIHTLLGSILESKGNEASAVTEYEAAKRLCGNCNEAGQQIAFFNLGVAYATIVPPRKNDAISELQKFNKIVCKGGAAQRYADQCAQAQQYATKLGGSLQ
jgi:tetratricopeptide (TPR) repeat protein